MQNLQIKKKKKNATCKKEKNQKNAINTKQFD